MSSFSDFYKKIANKRGLKSELFLFLDQVIRYKLILVDMNQVLPKIGPSVLATNNTFVFISQLKDDVNLVESHM